ncbi:ARM repeat-containing protein [Aulographum hederae CBS 113979]|uniref:ARM repeat-containing protein n=1 Tax=Aulographum hederae CBS 113979 TaxID=1176131 RepID=A0A6G1GVM0_9PEZI|nr:ARM repeat-containing protein [Aulographum hederae CBS 113979]
MDDQEFVQLLQSLLQPDTERVKAATGTLNKKYYTSPQSLVALIHVLTTHGDSGLRQLAAIEARKLVPKFWGDVPTNQKPQIRNQVLQSIFSEQKDIVRHGTSRVIATIASIDFEGGQWGDLPSLLMNGANSNQVREREAAVHVIFALLEIPGEYMDQDRLWEVFSKTLQDNESAAVRANTMEALSRMAMMIEADEQEDAVAKFQQLVPTMVNVLQGFIKDEDEENAMKAFEAFQTFLGCETALLAKHFGDLVRFMLHISVNKSLDDEFRNQALAFLMQCVRYRKLKIQGLRLGEELTLKALEIVPELGDLTGEEEDVTPARSALGLLDILASSLPPSQVVVPLLKAIGPYVTSEDPDRRRAGILALGMSVEGAPDFIATQLQEILPMVLHLLADPSVSVRAGALNGVARLADDLAENMGKEHAKLIPALIQNFDMAVNDLSGPNGDANLGIIKGSCNAVDSLIEGLEPEDAAKYVSELIPRFIKVVGHEEMKTKMAAVGAIGSVASAAEDAFLPYFNHTMQILGEYIMIKGDSDELDLRGAVCDAFGKIATAVGAEPFKQYLGPLMQSSEEALHLDHPRLRESTFILWSTMAKVYEQDFDAYLSGVVKGLLESLEQEEPDEGGLELSQQANEMLGSLMEGKEVKQQSSASAEQEIIDVEEADDDDLDWADFDGATAIAMEKEIAIEVIGDVLTCTKSKFLPYLQKTVEVVLGLADHAYEGVRKASLGTLWRAYACLWSLAEEQGMEKWRPGLPLQVQPPDELKKLGNLVMTATLGVWQSEEDRGAVTDINRDLGATLKLCGPALLVTDKPPQNVVEDITSQLLTIITRSHPCQIDLGGEDDPDLLEESSEYDWLVIETALDCMVCLSAALGPSFSALWREFSKPVLKFVSSQEATERSQSVGSIADCIGNMRDAVSPFTGQLLKVLQHRLGDSDSDAKANATYAIGLLMANSTDERELLAALPATLRKMEPMFGAEGRVLDNACGCVARIITSYGDQIPLGEILPRLVENLPLETDYEENKPVWNMVVKLYQAQNPAIMELTPQIKPALEKVLSPPEIQLDEETREQLMGLVQFLKA